MSKKKESQSKKKIVDIRRIPIKKKGGIKGGGILLTIGIALLLSYSVYMYQRFQNQGEQISLSEVVLMISDGEYEGITIKESEVILIGEAEKDTVFA